jgi:chromate transporter
VLVLTVGIFFPAFAFTLFGHDFFERLLHQPRLRLFLDGVTAVLIPLLIAGAALVGFLLQAR